MAHLRMQRGQEGQKDESSGTVGSSAAPVTDGVASAKLVPHGEAAARAMVQLKLAVGSTEDPAEREADAVAEQVVGRIRRGIAEHGDMSPKDVRRAPAGRIRRNAVVGHTGGAVDDDTEQRIQRRRGGGEPLPGDVAAEMSAGFGTDLSHVRLHTGTEASDLNNRLQARAFTVGSDVFLRDSTSLRSGAGQELLAHELTHVVQQSGGQEVARRYVDAMAVHEIDLFEFTSAGDQMQPAMDGPEDGAKRKSHPAGDVKLVAGPVELGNVKYYLLPGTKYYVREDNVQIGELKAEAGSNWESANEAAGAYDSVNEVGVKFSDDMGKAIEKSGGKPSDEMGKSADSFNILGSLAHWANALTSEKKSIGDWGSAGLDFIEGAGKMSAGVAGLVDKANPGEDGVKTDASRVSDASGAVADVAGGLQSTLNTVTDTIDLYKQWSKMSASQRAKKGVGAIQSGLKAAQSGVKAAKGFADAWGAAGPLASVVPGLGVAIAACDLIVRGVALLTAIVDKGVMKGRKRALKEKLGGEVGKSFKAKAEGEIETLKAKKELTEEEATRLGELEEYLMAKGIQYINSKRENRSLFKIGLALTNMAADIAILGGGSAPVGVAFKGAATATDASAGLFRRFKQWGRDKAAAAGEGSLLGNIFNANKSTDKKFAMYNGYVDKLYKMVLKANDMPRESVEEKAAAAAAAKNIYAYVSAMGMSKAEVDSLCTTPMEMRTKLIEKMKERE